MLPLPVDPERIYPPAPRCRPCSDTRSPGASPPQEVLLLDARKELSRLDRDQLAQLAAVLLEAMPSSYQWSVVASIRPAQRRRRPAGPGRLQRR